MKMWPRSRVSVKRTNANPLTLLRLLPLVLVSLHLGPAAVSGALEGPICGYAPLCGSQNATFQLDPTIDFPPTSEGGIIVGGASVEFDDCCSLPDTQPVQDCEIVNPRGASYRYVTSPVPLCSLSADNCEIGSCEMYAIVLRPTFIASQQSSGCCSSCSCYGDPICKSFAGEKKMWVLCDGREVPSEDDVHERCRITKDTCIQQKDHVGNQCVYLASNSQGKGWDNRKKGSPCVPNPNSPPSEILMYEAPASDFSLSVVQGERGIILTVYLQMSIGFFVLDAAKCLTDGEQAWTMSTQTLPPVFHRSVFTTSLDVLWNVVDPDTGIAMSFRCYGNRLEGDSKVYTPRINVEDVSDPFPNNRPDVDGFCVTGELDTGLATLTNSEHIEEGALCVDGLENFEDLEVYRAICENPAMPQAHINDCLFQFCSRNYLPLYDSLDQCLAQFTIDISEGFCRAIVFVEDDVDVCIDQWHELGAVPTIEQYFADRSGCVEYENLPTSAGPCQSGVTVQYQKPTGEWVDVIFVPDNYCGDGSNGMGEIVLNKCDHNELFVNPIRLVQNSVEAACGPVNQCKTISAFQTFLGFFAPPTPSPTKSPTQYPTDYPSEYPSGYPSLSPTQYPTEYPTNSPSNSPSTPYPTDYPSTSPTRYPTYFPSLSPTKAPTRFPTKFPTTGSPSTPYPTDYPTESPTRSPTNYPTPFPTTPYPTGYPTVPTQTPTSFPTAGNQVPTPSCEYRLCETPELYSDVDENNMFHIRMDSCCRVSPPTVCPPGTNVLEREQGSNQAYCGDKYPVVSSVKPSCVSGDKLEMKVMFMKNEDIQCCKTCTCYGDPRCISFDNVYTEFILCDGRTPPDNGNNGERCVIRRDTCRSLTDHAGNTCVWGNPKTDVPDFANPAEQDRGERLFNAAKWGSPCQYSPEVSPPSFVLIYKVDDFELTAQQYDRGYINKVIMKTSKAMYSLDADSCLAGSNWVVEERYTSEAVDSFDRTKFGKIYFWNVVAGQSGLEMGFRCTGVFYKNKISVPFINIEYINEPEVDRPSRGEGFCATNQMPEKALASTDHTDMIRTNGYCSSWNENTTHIIIREAARAFLDYPSLSSEGVERAYTEFCALNFSPRYKSKRKCVDAFLSSTDVSSLIKAFCKAVTLDSGPCEESLEMMSETAGYVEAFTEARHEYIETYQAECNVVKSNKLSNKMPTDHGSLCKGVVEVQYLNPGAGWITYKVLPVDLPPCNGFKVEFQYSRDKVMFEYPIRLRQQQIPDNCNACAYISTVDAWFTYLDA